MNPNNWLLWLVIGIAVGWLIEFLVDYYFFGRRNRELQSRVAEARAETDQTLWSRDEISTDLTRQTIANQSMQSKIDELEVAAASSTGYLRMLAARRGLVGALGNALLREERESVVRAVAGIEEAIAATEPLEHTVRRLQDSIALLNDDLGRAQAALRHQMVEYAEKDNARDAAERHKLGLLIAAGGPVSTLGIALGDGDETAIRREIAAIVAELTREPQVFRVEVPDKRAVEALKAEVTNATAKYQALQIEVDDLTASTLAMISRIGLLAPAGGALGDLGAALASGDESAVLAGVNEVTVRLSQDSPSTATQAS